jgi:hypothetical protein
MVHAFINFIAAIQKLFSCTLPEIYVLFPGMIWLSCLFSRLLFLNYVVALVFYCTVSVLISGDILKFSGVRSVFHITVAFCLSLYFLPGPHAVYLDPWLCVTHPACVMLRHMWVELVPFIVCIENECSALEQGWTLILHQYFDTQ